MSLGERCDEIVRLIDQALAECGVAGAAPGRAMPALAGAMAPGLESSLTAPGVDDALAL
jgi:hypothetical protein